MNKKYTYQLTIAYDGTRFSGWQIQPHVSTIQGEIEDRLLILLKKPIRVIGAARTDAGVHARGQVAHFSSTRKIPSLSTFLRSLNGMLPQEIRILQMEQVENHFHSCFDAKGKLYRYSLWHHPIASPFHLFYDYHYPYPLDISLMQQAGKELTGTHDFSSFAHHAHQGAAAQNAMRTIFSLTIQREGKRIFIECSGNGFLYKMVRNIVGVLLEIGNGKRSHREISSLLEKRDRRAAAMTAPAHALCLQKVFYTDSFQNQEDRGR